MKKTYSKIFEDIFENEVCVAREWGRLSGNLHGKKIFSWRFFSLQWAKYAAVLVFGVILSAGYFSLKEHLFAAELQPFRVVTKKGERCSFELPDGSKVWLNADTELSYTGSYGKANRHLTLSGEGYFQVAKNIRLPFVVRANGIDVTALGTSFNVRAYENESTIETMLYEGRVAVGQEGSDSYVYLAPKEVAVYDTKSGKIDTRLNEDGISSDWRDGHISFKMVRLEDISKMLERKYNVVFLFENREMSDLRFSGSFYNDDSLEDILNVLRINASMQYVMQGDTVKIK